MQTPPTSKGKNKRRAQSSVQSSVIASKQRVEDVSAPDPDQFINVEMLPLFVAEADRIDEVYLHNRNVLHRRITRRQQNVLQRLQESVQVDNKTGTGAGAANKKVKRPPIEAAVPVPIATAVPIAHAVSPPSARAKTSSLTSCKSCATMDPAETSTIQKSKTKSMPLFHQVVSLCSTDEETIEAVASPIESAVASETSWASASKIPVATGSHSSSCDRTKQWEREWSERLVMIRRIHSRQPTSGLLDPFPCRNRADCPFTTGSLMSQRYMLMQRLYQINQTIYGKSDPSMDRISLGNTLI